MHCSDYTRAQAGRGLPALEPGMPIPAGTGMSRRSFLLRSAGLALSVYGAGEVVPGALEEAAAQATGGGQRVLVSIFLSGGIDALSVLAPVGHPQYATLRSSTLVAASQPRFAEDTSLAWHPSAAGLQDLHAAGKLTVIPAMGYTSPNQSHFTSRHFYEVGSTDVQARSGWLGRYLDRVGEVNNPVQGLSLGYELNPSLASERVAVAAASTPDDYTFPTPGLWMDHVRTQLHEAHGRLGTLPTRDPVLAQARQAQANAAGLREDLDGLPANASAIAYPDVEFGRRLKGLAHMLGSGLGIRVATVTAHGNYDTHSGQATPFARNLQTTVTALTAFQADLEARGLADRVLTHVWSEFGRRPGENGSGGTDHGAAGLGLLMGTQASGRMIGEFPGLSSFDEQGNLRATSDFRVLYRSLLEGWLGTGADGIIPAGGGSGRYTVVR
jgi:uncharacterized protein (DUF1501 family)